MNHLYVTNHFYGKKNCCHVLLPEGTGEIQAIGAFGKVRLRQSTGMVVPMHSAKLGFGRFCMRHRSVVSEDCTVT